MTLYELTSDYLRLLEMAEDPEIDEEVLRDTMEGIDGAIEVKADGYAKVIKQLDTDIAGLKAEIDRLTGRAQTMAKTKDRIKKNLQDAMVATGKTKFKTELFSFGIQKNPASVIIEDETMVPKEFLIAQAPKIDKKAIKKAMDEGADCSLFARIEQGESLRIR